MKHTDQIEKILWSVALPGFGQLLNHKYFKGFILITLEIIVNTKANLNQIIMFSFTGNISEAIHATHYHWLLFYPCIYMFGIWDAFRDAKGTYRPFSYLPFVLAAYFATVGIMFSDRFRGFGFLWGPVWLPMLFAGIGIGVGLVLQKMLLKVRE